LLTVNGGAPGALVWKKTIVYGFGQELAEDQPGMGTTFIQSDHVGSPSVTTDPNGIVIGRSKNLPFGERYGSWGQKTIRRYTTHEDDADSGAIYMQAREYLPAYGKFAQVDPAYDQTKDDPESWNLYTYVTNHPVTQTDPDGRENPTYLNPEYSGPDDPWLPKNPIDEYGQDIGGGLAAYNGWMSRVAAAHLFNQAQKEAKEKGKPTVQVYVFDGKEWTAVDAVGTPYAFINGMNNKLEDAEAIAITEFGKDGITKDFNLVYIPTLGFWHDVFRAIADKLGFTTETAAQLAVVMQNAPRGTHWFAHSYGGIAFVEAARVIIKNGGSLAGDSVAFLAGANNPWVTSGILRGAGVKLIGSGYYDSQWDLVPNVLGLHVVSPLQWLADILNGWSLGTRWSPHHAPPMPSFQEINP
jgi:RHS repeat-associated protein